MTRAFVPESRELQVNGLRLHYLDWGGDAPQSALAFHGFALNCRSWDEVAPALRARVRLLAFDQRGHGLSQWAEEPSHYSRDAMAGDIAAIASALSLERPVVIGHSMGGMNAMTFAARHPERLRALVLVDVGPEIQVDGVNAVKHFVAGPYELESLDAWVEHTHRYYPWRSKERIRARLAVSLRETPEGRLARQYDPRFREANFAGIRETAEDLGSIARALRCPTLLVHGGASPVLSREQAERFAAMSGAVKLVSIPGAGHSVAGDKPEEFSKTVNEFLAAL